MILVSGAAGKTGRAVIRALVRRGADIRAMVHRREQIEAVRECGAQEVIVGEMLDPANWALAAKNVRAVYHVCPNVSAEELSIGTVASQAAFQAGIEHFVYHSVLHPQTEAMRHHWQKQRVEELLFECGVPYTILQPAAYMQNVLAGWDEIVTAGIYHVPYKVETRLGLVDLEDVAEAAALVLTQPGHEGAIYELAGPEALTQSEMAAILAQGLERSVRAETVPLDAWEQAARAAGLGDYQVETLLAMFRYYERYGFWGNAHVLEWLLGRPATSFARFVAGVIRSQPR